MKVIFAVLIGMLCSVSFGQHAAIKGSVVDETGEPVVFATVHLNDSIANRTDEYGEFRFHSLEKGKYQLKVVQIGYPPEQMEVKIKKDITYVVEIKLEATEVLLKPAIYLYSPEKIDVNISLENPDHLIFTHPKYTNEWQVTVEDNIISKGNQQFDYLFWEANKNQQAQTDFDETQGFCIAGKDAVQFLEESAQKLGFNNRESNDFVSFWGPRIGALQYAQIYFKMDDEYNEVMPIEVSPAPDVSRRVFMLVKPLKEPKHLIEQELTPINREGFVLIEWGGSLLKSETNL